MVEHVDDAVGAVLAALERHDLAGRTLVVFTSDNGGLIGNRGRLDRPPRVTDNYPLREGKGTAYEGGVRVPLIVRQPGRIAPGTRSSALVTSPDLYPTALAAASIAVPPEAAPSLDGIDLNPLLRGEPGAHGHEALFWHYPHSHTEGATPYSAIRQGPWKLIEFLEDDRVELYNLDADISERRDLAKPEPERCQELRQQLNSWRRSVGAQIPPPNPRYDPARAREFQIGAPD